MTQIFKREWEETPAMRSGALSLCGFILYISSLVFFWLFWVCFLWNYIGFVV